MRFINLLSNAIDYSRPGGKVYVSSHLGDQSERLVIIKDEGIGIPEDKLPRIFDEYYHTKEAKQHNKQSTGLGLAIVKHIAEINHIRIRVESPPGVGTSFELKFPSGYDFSDLQFEKE